MPGGVHGRTWREIYFAQFCFRGQRREDFERLYLGDYWSPDEHIPCLRRLPETQNSLNVRLDLREIAAAIRRTEGTIGWHLKHIFTKLHISRQADLVRLVLSVSSVAMSRR